MAADRMLAFARFDGVPLFWRVDIEVVGDPVTTVMYREPMPTWSLEESALMNGVAAVKAGLRGKDEEAFALLERAFARLGIAQPVGMVADQVRRLVLEVRRLDPRLEELSAELARLVEEHLDP